MILLFITARVNTVVMKTRTEIVTVAELFQDELDAINTLIVQLENQKKLSKDQRKEIHELKVVAKYFIDRLNNRMLIVDEEYTIH
jgi:hypothetical protein|tara:strand:- start:689 stop:943 length:255 start_codon:yes stop_codon:yes gene_type:complete